MKRSSSKNQIRMRIVIAFLFLTAFALCMVPGLYAKYTSSKNKDSSANVATFSVVAGQQYSSQEIIFGDIAPSESQSYAFNITTNSEVRVKCLVHISTTANLPLEYRVTSDDIIVKYDDSEDEYYFFLVPNQGLVALNLVAEWPSDKNSTEFLGEIDAVRLTVTAEQVVD